MSLWFLALKAREAGNRPRTFYTGLTVYQGFCRSSSSLSLYIARQAPFTISVNFDETEIVADSNANMAMKSEVNGYPGGITGFALVYFQITTNC